MSWIARIGQACVTAAAFGAAVNASAQVQNTVVTEAPKLNWAEKTFSELRHEFGTVAKFSDVKCIVEIKNIYEEPLTLASVLTTCGCIKATPDKLLLKTGEVAHVELRLNTKDFNGPRNVNLDVRLAFQLQGVTYEKSVRVPLTADIRSDVAVSPGNLELGAIEEGTAIDKHVQISGPVVIKEVKSLNPNVTAEFKQVILPTGFSGYDVTVKLSPKTPQGNINETLVIVATNGMQLPVSVHGKVEPDVVITPGLIPLGNLVAGQEKRISVVVKTARPMIVEKIECESPRDCFKVTPIKKTAEKVQILHMSVTPPAEPGDFSETFHLTIQGRVEPVLFKAEGKVILPTAAGTN